MTDLQRCAVYRYFNATGGLLYVGLSMDPRQRHHTHVATKKPWLADVASQTIEWFATRAEASDAEQRAIDTENPMHNIATKANAVGVLSRHARRRAVNVSLNEAEYTLICEAAEAAGTHPAGYLRMKALSAARRKPVKV